MHEFSAMQSIVNTILEKCKENRVEKVEKIILAIGKLTFLGKEQLMFAFEVLSKGTVLENAKLEIEDIDPEVQCEKCGYTGKIEYEDNELYHVSLPLFRCPKCAANVRIIHGKECVIRSMRVETEDEP